MTLLLSALLAAASPAKPVVTVLYFQDRSGNPDLQVLSKGVADMIITDLVAWDGVTVVERSRLDVVLGELQLQKSKAFDASTAVKVGKLIGAQYAISGSLYLARDELRIDATATSIERGETLLSASVTGAKDKVFDLEQQLVEQLVAAIDTKLKGSTARARAKVPSFEALLAYSKAIDLSDQGKHDEASKAMAALVSRSPTFAMAREKKQALLQRLEEYEKQKKDLITSAVLEIGKRADAELKKPFATKNVDGKRRHLLWRLLKGRYLMRVLKQSLSFRSSTRVVKVGQEPQALGVMRQWDENQRALIDELRDFFAVDRWPSLGVAQSELYELVRDSGLAGGSDLGSVSWENESRELFEFTVAGRASDGEYYRVAPPLGGLDPKAQQRAFDDDTRYLQSLEDSWRKARPADRARWENTLSLGLLQRGEMFEWVRRDDEAAQAYQKVLDLFPTGDFAKRAEGQIQEIIGAAHNHERRKREDSQRALQGQCDRFDVDQEVSDRLRLNGLPGVESVVKDMEALCFGRYELEQEWDSFYTSIARTFAQHEDCDRARHYYLKSFTWGTRGPTSFDHLSHYLPWCNLRLDEASFPTKVRLRAVAERNRDHEELDRLEDALEELLYDELAARGAVIDRGGNSAGHVEYSRLLLSSAGAELALVFEVSRETREGNTVHSHYEPLPAVQSKDGRIALDALLAPLLKELKLGNDPGPFKASASLAVATVVDYAAALRLYQDRKYDEARAAFEALAVKQPALAAAKARSAMAKEAAAKKK